MVDIDIDTVARSAGQVLQVSQNVNEGWLTAEAPISGLAAGAAGNTGNGSAFVTAAISCAEAAGAASDALGAALEHTSDALYRAAFDTTRTDEEQADRYRQ
ncbi:MAG: hypothetical protein ACK5KU_12100 [Beutenbergiaceae bacterium]